MKAYTEEHDQGLISIENEIKRKHVIGDIGIQIANDGRIWICIDGVSFLRFKPLSKLRILELRKTESKKFKKILGLEK